MAVPTFTRILPFGADIADPVEGPTGGRQGVEIYGNNFRLPDRTPVTPQPVLTVADVTPSVSVKFGGVEAVEVRVISPIKLQVITPITPIPATVTRMAGGPDLTFADTDPDTIVRSTGSWLDDGFFPGQLVRVSGTADNNGPFLLGDVTALTLTLVAAATLTAEGPVSDAVVTSEAIGEGTVDVVITNLDDNGVPIGGESITVEDAYTYRRPRLDHANQHDLTRMVRQVIREWKRQVLAEVVHTDSTDYDSDTVTAAVEIAQLPAIVLLGPDTPENRFYSVNELPDELVNGVVEIRRKPHTVDLLFDVVGLSDSTVQCLNLMASATEFMNRNPYIFLDRDPDDPAAGQVQYEFDFQPGGDFVRSRRANNSNLRTFSGSILVRGFDIEGYAGFADDAVRSTAEVLLDEDGSIILDVEPL